MDPLVKLLMERYGLSQDIATNYAASMAKGQVPAAEANPLRTAVVEQGAEGAIQRNNTMRRSAELFTKLHDAKSRGIDVGPDYEKYYQQVIALDRDKVGQAAKGDYAWKRLAASGGAETALQQLANMKDYATSFDTANQTPWNMVGTTLVPKPAPTPSYPVGVPITPQTKDPEAWLQFNQGARAGAKGPKY